MLVGGLYLLGVGFVFTDQIHVRPSIVALMLTTFGLYTLWAYFIAPLFGIKE